MKTYLIIVFFAIVSGVFGDSYSELIVADGNSSIQPLDNYREERFFPFFTVVRFANGICAANSNLSGTCFTRKECAEHSGTPSGSCAKGIGVCCVFSRSCGSTTNVNNTYFTNPNYPGSYNGGSRCTITITRCNSGICQLRLDFLDLQLAQPNGDGACITDFLTVSGGASLVPTICGTNTDQHVYVDFDGDNPIQLSIDTNSAVAFSRRWNIKITQIACDAANRAPTGCLMYYTGVSGNIKSFNYGEMTNQALDNQGFTGTREIARLNYGVCVQMAPGYCGITYSPVNNLGFTVTNDVETLDPSLIGTIDVQDQNCGTDFIVIPNPSQNNVAMPADRFCGLGLLPTTTYSKPFVLTVVTNENENGDVANRGFNLNYMQIPCTNAQT